MFIFASKRISLSPPVRGRLESLLAEFSALMGKTFATAERASATQDAFECRATFRQSLSEMEDQRMSLDLMIEELPAANKAWEGIRMFIDAQYNLITNADEWCAVIRSPAFDISTPQGQARYHAYVRKNREISARADRLFADAQRLLEQITGLQLPMP
jgi:hypothetical protein